MNFDDYKNPLPYPGRPRKPKSPGPNGTSYAYSDYANLLEIWEAEVEEWEKKKAAYSAEEARLLEKFKQDALDDVGLKGHPAADAIYAKAWEDGHSNGYSEVYNELLDLADLADWAKPYIAVVKRLLKERHTASLTENDGKLLEEFSKLA